MGGGLTLYTEPPSQAVFVGRGGHGPGSTGNGPVPFRQQVPFGVPWEPQGALGGWPHGPMAPLGGGNTLARRLRIGGVVYPPYLFPTDSPSQDGPP